MCRIWLTICNNYSPGVNTTNKCLDFLATCLYFPGCPLCSAVGPRLTHRPGCSRQDLTLAVTERSGQSYYTGPEEQKRRIARIARIARDDNTVTTDWWQVTFMSVSFIQCVCVWYKVCLIFGRILQIHNVESERVRQFIVEYKHCVRQSFMTEYLQNTRERKRQTVL